MPKKKGNRGKKPTRGNNNQREMEEYTQKSKCSVGSDELSSTFTNLSIIDSDDDEEVSAINSILQKRKCSVGSDELSTISNLSINVSGDEEDVSAINSILQVELLEQILIYLPIASIIIARSVCKKWREITSSTRFLWNASQTGSQKPWFFKFINYYENELNGYAYDPILQKWKGRDFMDMIEPYMCCDSSDGLVCYMEDNAIHVCNPITREHKMLQEPPRLIEVEGGCTVLINISVNLRAHKYNVSLLTFGSFGEISVQIYDSETMKWATSHTEVLTGWTIGGKSVICNRVLYFLIKSTGGGRQEHRLIAYDFSGNSSAHGTLLNSFIPLPCSNICGLMNLKGKLIIVAAIGRPGDEEFNNGFSIWLLKGKDWQEISRVTHTCFYFSDQLLGYSCSGAEDLIYIHSLLDPRLVVFDMNLKQWKDCQKCPMVDLFDGFCILPRLISP
ncbi:unnamed protein product [Rhodiola kirilowii]